ncbi:MAG: pantetheine-phosphate adenylyltransferase [Bdellovibrionales bacterium]
MMLPTVPTMSRWVQKNKMSRIGLFPGSFDPVTLGHVDLFTRAVNIVDELVIAVGENRDKKPLFSQAERVAILETEVAPLVKAGHKVRVTSFDTLLMEYVQEIGASVIIRGLRGVSDFDYEFQMAGMNRCLNDHVETVFLIAAQQYQFISSNFVKQIGSRGGDISSFVSPAVEKALKAKFS